MEDKNQPGKLRTYITEILMNVIPMSALTFMIAVFVFKFNRIAYFILISAGILLGVVLGVIGARKKLSGAR